MRVAAENGNWGIGKLLMSAKPEVASIKNNETRTALELGRPKWGQVAASQELGGNHEA